MIFVVKKPGKVALSENPIVFGLKTNNNIVTPGTKATIVLYFGSMLYGGSWVQFRLSFLGNTYTFTMAQTPDDSGGQFPWAISGESNILWMKRISEALYANFYISENYDITYTYNVVKLTAKEVGTAYNITGVNVSVPYFSVSPTPGTDKVTRNFFKLFFQILMGGNVVGEDMLPVNDSGVAYFDIAEYLKPEVKNTFAFPETTNEVVIKRADACKSYAVRYAEFYSENDLSAIRKMNSGGTFYALTGGVNAMTQANYNILNSNFWLQLLNNHKFLTWHPGKKKTAIYDIQKLYYLVHTNIQSQKVPVIKLKAGLNYKLSGQSTITTQVFTKATISASMYDVLEICCGYSRLNLDADAATLPAGTWVVSYDIFLTDNAGNIISEIKNFLLDERTYMNYKTFIFRNSFGMYETIRCTSVQQREAGYENIIVDNYRQWSFTNKNADSKKDKVVETARSLINTGWITEDEMNWARELFLSREVYEIKNNNLYPVVLTSETVKLGKDREFLYNVEFEYIHGYTDQHYSLETYVKKLKLPVIIIENNIPIQSINYAVAQNKL